jgi:hypothetical protein
VTDVSHQTLCRKWTVYHLANVPSRFYLACSHENYFCQYHYHDPIILSITVETVEITVYEICADCDILFVHALLTDKTSFQLQMKYLDNHQIF